MYYFTVHTANDNDNEYQRCIIVLIAQSSHRDDDS